MADTYSSLESDSTDPIKIDPIKPVDNNNGDNSEVILKNHPQVIRAKTSNTISIIRYAAGSFLILSITLSCLYVVVLGNGLVFHDDAARILLIVVGAVTASMFATVKEKDDDS